MPGEHWWLGDFNLGGISEKYFRFKQINGRVSPEELLTAATAKLD